MGLHPMRGLPGLGVPASLGAKCAMPDRPVVCFTGDGGFWYHMQELETAVRCDIPSVTFVNNNRSMNQEIDIYMRAYDGKPSDRWGEMWHFTQVNFSRIAEEMGALGIRVEKQDEIAPALDQALSSDRPALVEVITDMEAIAPKAFLG